MENSKNSFLKIFIVSIVSAFVIIAAGMELRSLFISPSFGAVNIISDRSAIQAIGTSSAPATLSQLYANNTSNVLKVQGLSNVVIGGVYTPKSYNPTLYLQVERSLDNGNTYLPYDVISPATDRVYVYDNSFVTSSTGVPFQVPGGGTSTSGTAQSFSFDLTLAADFIRVSAKEQTTSTAGTLYVQLYSTNH